MIRIVSISVSATLLLFWVLHLLNPLPDKIDYSTIITDNRGQMIHAFLTSDDKWRMETSLDEISPMLRKTIVQKEDRFFYYHHGVNPFAIVRACFNNIFQLKRTSGASTITMQVARALERKPRNYTNKLKEIFRAVQLELKYSKSDILRMYCSLLPYGGNIEGVKAASLLYFNKDPDHLSLAEITALSIIPNKPSTLVPGKNNIEIKRHRDMWLNRFAKQGVFTQKEITDALGEPFEASRGTFPVIAPHLARELKRSGSTLVRSSLDVNIQNKAEKIVRDYTRSTGLRGIRNAAVMVIDNATHRVVAYVGSAAFDDTLDAGQVNGINAVRQPGSTLKPFVYGMCIDEGLITPRSTITDVQVSYDGYAPENYDRRFHGYVTATYALEHSLNIPAVKALQLLGKDRFVAMLGACQFRQVRADQKKLGLSLILGGCGATLSELTGLYSALANEGEYVAPVLTMDRTSTHAVPLMSSAAAFMITDILSNVNRPDFPLSWQSTGHMPKIAWKTGTSYGRRDAWSIGYNKKFTVGVWAGNFSGKGVPDLSGAEIATPLLFRLFNTIDYDSDEAWFTKPSDCDLRMVCSETGMPPGEHCAATVSDYFIPMISPTRPCDNTREEIVSPAADKSYCRLCMPQTGYKRKRYKIVPPEMQLWLDERGIAYDKVPPHNPSCEQVFRTGKPVIMSPRAGSEYLISKSEPEPLQLQCRAENDVSTVYWYIDNRFYKAAVPGAPVFFVPSEGPVKISCTDDKGRNRDSWISVRYTEF